MISIDQLSFGYNQENYLFKNMSLSIGSGGVCGLLGENGSGKTTLLKMIAGLIFPTEGNCLVMNQTPSHRQPSFLQDTYFLSEDIYVPAITADDYIKYFSPFYPKFNNTLLLNYLTEFDLPRNKLLNTFSHGQKKKFLIAFGLATNSRLLILDEPTNGLDIPSKAQFRKLIASTVCEDRLIIISTHQVHDIENLIDSIVILHNGAIIFHQTISEIANYLAFIQQPTLPDNSSLYYEKNLQGYISVNINNGKQDTHIDLEALFNAALANKTKLQQIFDKDKS